MMYVMASNRQQFMNFIHKFAVRPSQARLINSQEQMRGLANPIYILEGYEHNPDYTVNFAQELNFRVNMGFITTHFVSERKIYS